MRLIDADKLRKKAHWMEMFDNQGIAFDVKAVSVSSIDLAPTIEAEPVRHGQNENKKYHEVDEFRCSECGLHLEDWTRYVCDEDSNEEYVQEYVFKRCPECGARIVSE